MTPGTLRPETSPGRFARRLLGILSIIAGMLPVGTALAEPRFEDGHRATFLPFLGDARPGAPIRHSPHLGLSFGDGDVRPVLMDTGSTGIVVSASRIPDADTLPSRPGRLTYSSSGRIMIGRWVTTPVSVWGRDGVHVTTKPIPVLAVDRIDCTAKARNCTPAEAPAGVAMMGVGFGREGDSQAQSTPDTNPLLNVAPDDPGPVHRGYVLTRNGIHVGLTPANTRGDFHFIKLDPSPDIPGEWLGVPVCIAVNDGATGSCGRGLLDTGVSAMFLTLPPDAVAGSTAPNDEGRPALVPGTRLSFSFPGRADVPSAATYTLAVGEHTALSPERIVLNTTRPEPFVNTGLRVLNGFDILYDADGGTFGFRARDSHFAEQP